VYGRRDRIMNNLDVRRNGSSSTWCNGVVDLIMTTREEEEMERQMRPTIDAHP